MNYNFSMESEEICDYVVSAEMKKIWKKQLEMVEKFDELCKKHGINYFVSGGTLIGAVRHKGYIPWDDDIDIHMLAEDYEKFRKVAIEELKPYVWQDWETQPGFYPYHAKIRNDSTTGCTLFELDSWPDSLSKGIFIDIFPLHYVPDNKIVKELQKFILLFLRFSTSALSSERRYKLHPERYPYNKIWNVRLIWAKILHCLPEMNTIQKVSKKYIQVCEWQKKPSKLVGALSFDPRVKRFMWPTEYYRSSVRLPFMGGTVSAPVEWDGCLRQQFGDYNVIVRGGSMHSHIIFDPDTPWRERLVGELERHEPFKEKIKRK